MVDWIDALFHLPSAQTVKEVAHGLALGVTHQLNAPLRPADIFAIGALAVAAPIIVGTTLAGGAAAGTVAGAATASGASGAVVGGSAAAVGVGGTLGAVAITTAGNVAKTGIVAGTAWSLLQDPKILALIGVLGVGYLYFRSKK